MGFKYKLTRAAGVFSGFNVAEGRYLKSLNDCEIHDIGYAFRLRLSSAGLV